MKLSGVLLKYLVVIILGLIIFGIDRIEHFSATLTVSFIIGFSAIKSVYAIYFLYRKIVEVSVHDTLYHKFLLFIAVHVALIILSFSIDFFCLSEVAPYSFSGVSSHLPFYQRYFDFLYFSILAFTNFGYDQVSPATFGAKFLMSSELLISFITIIFILSDFISLKDSINKSKSAHHK